MTITLRDVRQTEEPGRHEKRPNSQSVITQRPPEAFMLAPNGETIREQAQLPPIAYADLATM
jgi:hypothetical protein